MAFGVATLVSLGALGSALISLTNCLAVASHLHTAPSPAQQAFAGGFMLASSVRMLLGVVVGIVVGKSCFKAYRTAKAADEAADADMRIT